MRKSSERKPGPHHGKPGGSLAGYAACGAYVHAHRMTARYDDVKCRECRAELMLPPLIRKKRERTR